VLQCKKLWLQSNEIWRESFCPHMLVWAEKSFLCSSQRKFSLGRNFWTVNSDKLLNGMVHDSLFLDFLDYGLKKHV
jgi:hypothetical protein